MEFKEVKLTEAHTVAVLTFVLPCILVNNGNNHDVSKRQRVSMVDRSVQLSIIRLMYSWKLVVE